MSEPASKNPQGRPVARPKQPVVRQRPGQGSGAVPGWMRPQGKTAKQTSMPSTSYQGTRKAAPVTASSRLPFVFLDRAHVSQALGNLIAKIKGLVPHARGATLSLVAALLLVYLSGALYFHGRYLPGTRIDGLAASFKTPKEMAALAKDYVANYQLAVEGDGLSLALDAKQAGVSLDEEAFVEGASAHVPAMTWPLALLENRDYAVTQGISYDEERVRETVSNAVTRANEGASPTANATVAYQNDTQSFAIVDEQWGTTLDEEAAEERVVQSVATLQDRLELDKQVLVKPTLFADDPRMAAALDEANARKDLSIDLTVWGETVRTLDPHVVRQWFTLDDSCKLVGDLAAITEWAQGPLSKEFDSAGGTRTYIRPDDGKYVEVTGGTYGWVVDGAALADLVCARITEGSSEPVEIPMKGEGAVFAPGGQDWGGRYLDVDLSEQYVRFFDGGANIIWESECVSGDPYVGNDTVTGVYAIYDKESPKKLIGLDYDSDGEPDYENDVDFWMPFYSGYGFHDATWRGYFGPDAYLYGGSHGCINLPYEAAQSLFSIVMEGDVVVVHY